MTKVRIKRLQDREARRHLNVYRKRVYSLGTENNIKILYKFSPKYRNIFDNYRKAVRMMGALLGNEEWHFNEKNLTVQGPFLGKNYDIFSTFHLQKIGRCLEDINKLKPEEHKLLVPRYITKLVKEGNELNKFGYLKRLLEIVKKSKQTYQYGCGIDDPAWANFVFDRDEVFLVDLDNFNMLINLDYELGFLLADTEIHFEIETSNRFDDLWQKSEIFDRTINPDQLLLGYVARLATIIFDYQGKEVDKRLGIEAADKIELLCKDLVERI